MTETACARCGKAITDESRVEFRGQSYHRRCEYERPVTLVRVDIPFAEMVSVALKWMLACVMATLIVAVPIYLLMVALNWREIFLGY